LTTPAAEYVAASGQRDFDVPFPFLNRSHVEVLVNGAKRPVLEWVGSSRLRLAAPCSGGELVVVQRDTPIDAQLVSFSDGAILTQEDLNTAVQQLLFKQQEIVALYEGSLRRARVRLAENLGIVTDPGAVAQELAELVLEQQVLDNFRQRIADIDLNADAITAQAFKTEQIDEGLTQVDAARQQLANHVAEVENDLDNRVLDLRTDVTTLTATVDALASSDPGAGLATMIQEETLARVNGDRALVQTINLIGARSNDSRSFVLNLNSAKVSPSESLAQRLSALSASDIEARALIATEETARVTAVAAEAGRIDALTTRMGAAEASVVTERNARVSAVGAEASRIDALLVRMGAAEASVVDETNARVSAIAAEAIRINGLLARMGTAEANITAEQTARSNADGAITTSLNALTARVGTAEGAITTEQTARANGDSALASSITALTGRVGTAEAAITAEQTARANGDTAIANTLALLGARNGAGTAFILDLSKAMVSSTETLAQRFSALSSEDGTIRGLIQSEATTRANADSSLATSINTVGAKADANAAAIVDEQTARANGDTAEATARTQLASVLRDETDSKISAAIQTEATTRASADGVFANQFTLLGAKNGAGTAWVLNDSTVLLSNGTALGTLLSGIDVAIGNNAAAIVSEQTARTDADNALSQSIQVVNSQVGNLSASVSTLAQSVDGVKARYGVSLDVNGYVTGFVQNNDGSSGSFVILADRFAIVQPGAAPFVPFEVSGGVTRIKSALIGELQVNKLSSGTLNAEINVGTGKVIFDNGTYMKVTGVGFGTANQFIEWFGPKLPISSCSEANAISFLKTNGDAYFGGSLSAGTLTNRTTSSATAANAQASLGPFGSNGNPKTVTLSYTYLGEQATSTSCPVPLPVPEATLQLYKGPQGDTAQLVASLSVSGTTTCVDGAPGEPGRFVQSMSGSTTWTDNSAALLGYEFWARIVTRDTQSNGTASIVITQRISIISVEE
jgi:hypothetical protein